MPSDNKDLALLLLRLSFAVPLLLKHGIEKVTTFPQMSRHFPNPVHIGPIPTFIIALISDFICSILVIVGWKARFAALFIFCDIAVAWVLVHHFEFFGHGADHGEMMVLYMGASATVALAGPGGISLDGRSRPKRKH